MLSFILKLKWYVIVAKLTERILPDFVLFLKSLFPEANIKSKEQWTNCPSSWSTLTPVKRMVVWSAEYVKLYFHSLHDFNKWCLIKQREIFKFT